jgi:hypothetical protein
MPNPKRTLGFFASPALWVFSVTATDAARGFDPFCDTPFLFPEGDDMYFYHSWGIRILAGQWTDHQAFYGLPGYAFLLSLTYEL